MRIHKSNGGLPFQEELELRVWEEVERRVMEEDEAISLHILFEDFGEYTLRSLPLLNSESYERSLDWYHDIQSGTLYLVEVGEPHAKPTFQRWLKRGETL